MSKGTSRLVAALTAIVVTVAAFAKIFVPFYLIGSTPIFVTSCFIGLLLIALASRNLIKQTTYATDVLVLLILFYSTVVASFLINSLHLVAITHLLGILIFHGSPLLENCLQTGGSYRLQALQRRRFTRECGPPAALSRS